MDLFQGLGEVVKTRIKEGGVLMDPKPYELRYSNQPFCPRQFYYAQLPENEPQPFRERFVMHSILELGHVVHLTIQNMMVAFTNEDPDFVFLGFIDEDGNYEEFHFESLDKLKFPSGHADGLIWYKGYYFVLEIKTINDRGYAKLKEPKNTHRVQANCYARKFKLEHGYDVQGILFVYVHRERVLDWFENEDYIQCFEDPLKPKLADDYESLVSYAVESNENKQLPMGICSSYEDMGWCNHCDRCKQDGVPFLDKSEESQNFIQFIEQLYPADQPKTLKDRNLRGLMCKKQNN